MRRSHKETLTFKVYQTDNGFVRIVCHKNNMIIWRNLDYRGFLFGERYSANLEELTNEIMLRDNWHEVHPLTWQRLKRD